MSEVFYYTINGRNISAALDPKLTFPIIDLDPKLHALMKAHTGVDWKAFTLLINEDGSMTTQFAYRD